MILIKTIQYLILVDIIYKYKVEILKGATRKDL